MKNKIGDKIFIIENGNVMESKITDAYEGILYKVLPYKTSCLLIEDDVFKTKEEAELKLGA